LADALSIIDRLGGRELVAVRCHLTPSAVKMWERRDMIPWRWHVTLLSLAVERGVSLSMSELIATRRKER